MSGHKAKSCMLLTLLQILVSQSLARQAVMAPSNEDQSESTTTSVHEKLPYITTEEATKLNVIFTSDDMKGKDPDRSLQDPSTNR